MDELERTTLRGGYTTADPRLDRLPEWDDRNLSRYAVAELLEPEVASAHERPTRGRSWRAGPVLDQGREGACVGFAYAADVAADPVLGDVNLDEERELDTYARKVYRRAQRLDPWPDDVPYEGTSILAGAKASVEAGAFPEYRWATGVDELVTLLTTPMYADPAGVFGPTIAGVAWFEGMYRTAPDGMVEVSGRLVGGHAILVRGVLLHDRRSPDEPLFRWRNSWGPSYGVNGDGFIRASDLERILGPRPELCVPVSRTRPAGA